MTDHIDAPKAELLPCPFCGGKAEVWPDERGSGGQHVPPYHAGCPLPACGVAFTDDRAGEAIAAWNRRAARTATMGEDRDLIERLREGVIQSGEVETDDGVVSICDIDEAETVMAEAAERIEALTRRPWEPHPSPYAQAVAPYVAAQRMVREAIGELFGPLASIESDEAVLRRGPEPKHEAEAQIAALRRVAQEREAVGMAIKPTATQIDAEMLGMPMDMVQRVVDWFWPLVSPPVEAKPAKGVREEQLIEALNWALGCGEDFPAREDGEGAYWWRRHLAERAGLHYDKEIGRYVPALSSLEPTAPQEPVAWRVVWFDGFVEYTEDKESFDFNPQTPPRLEPLYASPPATASGVSEEMVERALAAWDRHGGSWPTLERMQTALEAALNLGREG